MIDKVLKAFGINTCVEIIPLQQGLINSTWKVNAGDKTYVLQKVNDQVFQQPELIDKNINVVAGYLAQREPNYLFVGPLKSVQGNSLIYVSDVGYFRVFPFVPNSRSIDVVETAAQAFEAAQQFGRFTRTLAGVDLSDLAETIPHFHNLSLRYLQFERSIENGNPQRRAHARDLVQKLVEWNFVESQYKMLVNSPECKLRVTHHDTKISNVLFDPHDKAICVIDLDTVMPGYFFSDVGDMMRTYLSPVSEEETNLDKIEVRDSFYDALVRGYYSEMKDELTDLEKENFFFAGAIMIYMQAIRFLTDYLNMDQYYAASYPLHNYHRALNQATLLERFFDKQILLEEVYRAVRTAGHR